MFNFYQESENFLIKLADEIESKDLNSILDVEYSDGILSISINSSGKQYVINRHNANSKIWYSSPFSGADYFSFDLEKKKWLNSYKQELSSKLFDELNKIIN